MLASPIYVPKMTTEDPLPERILWVVSNIYVHLNRASFINGNRFHLGQTNTVRSRPFLPLLFHPILDQL